MTDVKLYHQFSPGVIACYYSGDLKKNDGFMEMKLKTGPKEKRNRYWMIDKLPQHEGILYSVDKINQASSKKNEIFHDLDEVFDKSLYTSSKSFYNSVTYGPRWIEKSGYIFKESKDDVTAVQTLLKNWASWKLENPKLFRASFFWNQYKRSIDVAFKNPNNYILFTLWKDDELVATHVLYKFEEYAYSLAFFGKWEKSLSNYFEIVCLSKLREQGIKYLNRGYEMNKGLSNFKGAWPSKKLSYYVTKLTEEKSQLSEFFC